MLSVEADILAFDLDSLRLLRAYREAGLTARAERTKIAEAAAAAIEEQQLAPEEASDESGQPVEVEESAEETPVTPERDKGDPWVERISEMEFVEPEQLSELHGKLIAAGFLNFQIRNRHTGVEYRIANAGKQFLTRAVEEANDFADARESASVDGSESLRDDVVQLAQQKDVA